VARRLLLIAAGLVAAWVVACLVFFTWSPWDSGAPAHADVVVVLSGNKRRLPTALALIRRGVAPVLALSSVERTKHWAEAERLCRTHHYAGARVICFTAVPFSTRGECDRPHDAGTRVAVDRRRHVPVSRHAGAPAVPAVLARAVVDGRCAFHVVAAAGRVGVGDREAARAADSPAKLLAHPAAAGTLVRVAEERERRQREDLQVE
jgi:hypothetical protein